MAADELHPIEVRLLLIAEILDRAVEEVRQAMEDLKPADGNGGTDDDAQR